jgi:hypothetical protein
LKSAFAKLIDFDICVQSPSAGRPPLYDTATNPNDITTTKLPASNAPARLFTAFDEEERASCCCCFRCCDELLGADIVDLTEPYDEANVASSISIFGLYRPVDD